MLNPEISKTKIEKQLDYNKIRDYLEENLTNLETELEDLLIFKNHQNLLKSTSPFLSSGHIEPYFIEQDDVPKDTLTSLVLQEIANNLTTLNHMDFFLKNYPDSITNMLARYKNFYKHLKESNRQIITTDAISSGKKRKAIMVLSNTVQEIITYIESNIKNHNLPNLSQNNPIINIVS
jgi:hypothetical protein